MTKILHGSELGERIRDLLKGETPIRCAVAFWGPQIASLAKANKAKVILDLSMSGNSKNALKALGVPKNPNIKVLNGLHSKIYIGEKVAIVGSANASGNALGHEGQAPQHFEAGVMIDKEESPKLYAELETLFAKYTRDARQVTKADLEKASNVLPPPPARDSTETFLTKIPSLFNVVRATPEIFQRTTFAFVREKASIEDKKVADEQYNADIIEEKIMMGDRFVSSQRTLIVTNCDNNDDKILSGSRNIIMWFGSKPELLCYQDIHRVSINANQSAYYGVSKWPTVRAQLGLHRSFKKHEIWQNDQALAQKILRKKKWLLASQAKIYSILEEQS